jgi:hypothetical protein
VKDAFERYLLELRKSYADGAGTEMSGRSALEALLNAFGTQQNPVALVQHEPKRAVAKGAPDFKVSRQGMILGYVENKMIGENLDQVLKSEQIKKYLQLSDNILLTDYLHWIWINKDGIQRDSLCHATDLENRKFKLRPSLSHPSRQANPLAGVGA